MQGAPLWERFYCEFCKAKLRGGAATKPYATTITPPSGGAIIKSPGFKGVDAPLRDFFGSFLFT